MSDRTHGGELRWGVIGVGIAGGARVRALRADPRARVLQGWRGRVEEHGLAVAGSLDALLEGIDAVAICSPDDTHVAYARAALERRLHVLCEYPLAGSVAEAEALLRLARAGDRTLHVEQIALLTPQARWLRARLAGSRPRSLELRSTSRARPGVWSLAFASLARLHRVLDLCGPPEGVEVRMSSPERIVADLLFADGRASLDLRMAEGLSRSTTLRVLHRDVDLRMEDRRVFEDGTEVALPPSARGLFAEDQLHATARMLDGARGYLTEERLLAALDLAEALHRAG